MRHIQDKKIDNLFKDGFEYAEMAPSAGLWAAIEGQLEVKAVKRKFPVYWAVAAAVIVLMATGVLLTKPEKIKLHGAEQTIVEAGKKVNPIVPQKTNDVITSNRVAVVVPEKKIARKTADVSVLVPVLGTNLKRELTVIQPIKTDGHLHVVVEKLGTVANPTQVVLASVQPSAETPDEVINENDQTEKRGIRNVGDLINYVVDKVDKREQKILQFKTDDDDNSSLVAINIGFIKFNKKHK